MTKGPRLPKGVMITVSDVDNAQHIVTNVLRSSSTLETKSNLLYVCVFPDSPLHAELYRHFCNELREQKIKPLLEHHSKLTVSQRSEIRYELHPTKDSMCVAFLPAEPVVIDEMISAGLIGLKHADRLRRDIKSVKDSDIPDSYGLARKPKKKDIEL